MHETDGTNLNATDGGFWVDTVNDIGAGNELTSANKFTGLTNGANYQLSFDLGNRIGNDAIATGELNLGSVNVYWGGQLVATVSKSTYGWQSFSYTVQAGAGNGNNTLVFEQVGSNQLAFGHSLDNVRLEAVAATLAIAENGAATEIVGKIVVADVDAGENLHSANR